jgi:succinate dehydrogenase/fumarate reductase flavoprotein subunit
VNSPDETVDVLVAGSGGGIAGAYTAAREGLSVALVEAGDQFGGTFAYSGGGGMWFPCNPVLVRAGSDDTMDEALRYYRGVVGERTPAALQETYVRGGAALIGYLEADEHFASAGSRDWSAGRWITSDSVYRSRICSSAAVRSSAASSPRWPTIPR